MTNNDANNGLITVIVPVYNGESTISSCIDSITSQSYSNIEVIIVDDGSTDGTAALIDGVQAADARVKAIHIANGGVSAARNLALSQARGEYVLFVDADDSLVEEAIADLWQGAQESGASLVIGGFDRYDPAPLNSPDSVVFPTSRLLKMPAIVAYVCKYLDRPNKNPLFVFSWGRLIKTSVIKEHNLRFNEDLRTMEDVQFNLRLLQHIDCLYYVAKRLYRYRIYTSASSQTILALMHHGGLTGFVPALETARDFLVEQTGDQSWANRWVGQAYVTYTIVHLVRLCVLLTWQNFRDIRVGCDSLVNVPQVQQCIAAYTPSPGDSKILPLLIKRRQVALLMVFSKYKAWLRYSRSRPAKS